MESTLEKIIRRTGMKPSSCKCVKCKSQCQHPCIGTPSDILKLALSGYGDRLQEVNYSTPVKLGLCENPVPMFIPEYNESKKSCTFLVDGLCELHTLGLKPTEGKLSHHSTTAQTFVPKKSIGWAVAKEWREIDIEKYKLMIQTAKTIYNERKSTHSDPRP